MAKEPQSLPELFFFGVLLNTCMFGLGKAKQGRRDRGSPKHGPPPTRSIAKRSPTIPWRQVHSLTNSPLFFLVLPVTMELWRRAM